MCFIIPVVSAGCSFSIFQENNTHVARCDHFNTSVDLGGNVILRDGNCAHGESCLFSQFQHNNSHIASCGYYNYSLCSNELSCVISEDACPQGAVGSFFQVNDSHWASAGYYNYSLCCRSLGSAGGGGVRRVPLAIIPPGLPIKKTGAIILFMLLLVAIIGTICYWFIIHKDECDEDDGKKCEE